MSTDALSSSPPAITTVTPTSAALAKVLEHAVVIPVVPWEVYVALRDNPDNRGIRMTYDEGALEIMTLSAFHELISMLIDHFILEWRVARKISAQPSGSLTLRQEVLKKGLEGDQSYYIQHESQVRGLEEIDLETNPPPDLAVEVEHTSSAVRKMPIYAALGVPEVWRWCKESLSVHRLVDGQYVEQTASEALPGFPLDQLRQALQRRATVDETTLLSEFRQWLQSAQVD